MKNLVILFLATFPACSQHHYQLKLSDGKLYVALSTGLDSKQIPIEFHSKSKGITYDVSSGFSLKNESAGIVMGVDMMKEFPQPVLFDFENMTMTLGYKASFEGFPVNSKFTDRGIDLALRVRWKDYRFAMDTHQAITRVRRDKKMRFLAGYSQAMEGGRFYPNVGIGIGGRDFGSGLLICDNCTTAIGTNLISGFNWLVNFSSKTISVKKNSRMLEQEFTQTSPH